MLEGSRFRLRFYQNEKINEFKWVIFTDSRTGSVGKLIFTIHRSSNVAKIKNISLDPSIRGLGLSTVLFRSCLSTLMKTPVSYIVLDAEEDCDRYDRLIELYKSWGFQVQNASKYQVLHHSDHTFRKVSMKLQVVDQDIRCSSEYWFQMIRFANQNGQYVKSNPNGGIYTAPMHSQLSRWQCIQLKTNGCVSLRNFYAKFLCAEPDGQIVANRSCQSTWESFQIIPLIDGVFIQTFHGLYLGLQDNQFISSSSPFRWSLEQQELSANRTLRVDKERLHYRWLREYHSLTLFRQLQFKYTAQHGKLSLRQACDLLNPKLMDEMLTLSYQIQLDGHPDWFQLFGFLYGLGTLLFHWIDEQEHHLFGFPVTRHPLDRMQSWILGARIPDTVLHADLNIFNADHQQYDAIGDHQYPCQIQSVSITYGPDQYLYDTLVHNQTSLPSEGLEMIRLRSLKCWYGETDAYSDLLGPDNQDLKQWVRLFAKYIDSEKQQPVGVDKALFLDYMIGLSYKYLPPELEW